MSHTWNNYSAVVAVFICDMVMMLTKWCWNWDCAACTLKAALIQCTFKYLSISHTAGHNYIFLTNFNVTIFHGMLFIPSRRVARILDNPPYVTSARKADRLFSCDASLCHKIICTLIFPGT